MYVVKHYKNGVTYVVVTRQNPRADGFAGPVEEGISLDYDPLRVHKWRDGERRTEPVIGRSPADAKHLKVFRCDDDLRIAGFRPLAGSPMMFDRWTDYVATGVL